jgi:spore coat polysaccharide biosynthesis protein SpsF
LDIDAFTMEALDRAWKSASLRTTRRHPVSYFYQHRDEFRIENFTHEPNLGHLRWTLDYPEDLEFVRAVFDRLYPGDPGFGMKDIIGLLGREPELGRINGHLSRYIEGQPAYWDSEGYMADVRADLRTVLELAFTADAASDLSGAARHYAEARRLLDELQERAVRWRR